MLRSIISGLASAAVLSQGVLAQDYLTDASVFYGESEPVYPTPQQTEDGAWADAISKAKTFVSQMSLEEKVNLTGGVDVDNGCSGFITSIPRLNFPGLCLNDAGNGLRGTDYVSAWPSAIHVGASWNKDLAYQRANFMGGEAKTKGVNVLLGPMFSPIGRIVLGGRNWEGFSPDPYLSGELVYVTIKGTQDAGVITSAKAFIGQEQESHRLSPRNGDIADSVSSNIDDRTLHELYLWPFADAVKAGTGNIMCSYNKLNNSASCANSKGLNGILKGELGFQGWVVSDWGAQHSGVASFEAGLDVAMPLGATWWGSNLTLAVNNGTINETQLDEHVTRILSSWYQLGQDQAEFPLPGVGMPADVTAPHKVVDARNASAKPTLLGGAIEGHVLVKNTNSALPLKSADMKLVSLFGYSAKAPNRNNQAPVATGQRFSAWEIGSQSFNVTQLNQGFFGNLSIDYSAIAPNGTLISGGGSGANSWSRISAPYDALVTQAEADDTDLYWDFEGGSPLVNPTSNACLVMGNAFATEGYDRPSAYDDFTDALIQNVADQCANTIVVLHNAGTRLVDTFIDHPNVTAVIFAHLPGQDSGRALISLLYGKENPSGRLPYTVARNESDYEHLLSPDVTLAPNWFERFPQSNFTEGVFIDYRHFDLKNITPRYEFGFGLSYTTFDYANLQINQTDKTTQLYPIGTIAEGGQTDLWDELVYVTADVTNSGSMDGKEVAQLYLGIPGNNNVPEKQLRGFEKPTIKVGETTTVRFALRRRDLSIWDVVAQKWLLQTGEYSVFVGRSSRDLPLVGSFTIA